LEEIAIKKKSVAEDLSKVEPAVQDAQNGEFFVDGFFFGITLLGVSFVKTVGKCFFFQQLSSRLKKRT
jgi:hypothetical protein